MTSDHYHLLGEFLELIDAPVSAPEFHGLMTGTLCAGGGGSPEARRKNYASWVDADVTGDELALLETVHEATAGSLGDFADLDLRLLLPDDEAPIHERGEALASWCTGFLGGFGAAISAGSLAPEVSEVLSDYSEISRISEQLPEGEDNEADLMELHEYVRVSTIFLYSELGGR